MEESKLSFDENRRTRLLAELERHGVKPKIDLEDAVLERLLKVLQNRDNADASNETIDNTLASYTMMLADYIYKMTIASVLFFASNPWAALWWPPFYCCRSK